MCIVMGVVVFEIIGVLVMLMLLWIICRKLLKWLLWFSSDCMV